MRFAFLAQESLSSMKNCVREDSHRFVMGISFVFLEKNSPEYRFSKQTTTGSSKMKIPQNKPRSDAHRQKTIFSVGHSLFFSSMLASGLHPVVSFGIQFILDQEKTPGHEKVSSGSSDGSKSSEGSPKNLELAAFITGSLQRSIAAFTRSCEKRFNNLRTFSNKAFEDFPARFYRCITARDSFLILTGAQSVFSMAHVKWREN